MARLASGSPSTSDEPAPVVTVSFSGSISPQGKNADPVIARQFEQWQLYATTNSSETSNATALHAQRPLNTTELCVRSPGPVFVSVPPNDRYADDRRCSTNWLRRPGRAHPPRAASCCRKPSTRLPSATEDP